MQDYLVRNRVKDNLDIEDFVSWGKNNTPQRRAFETLQKNITPKGIELLQKFTFLTGKGVFDIARYEHWGIGADQRIVCVDTGLGG